MKRKLCILAASITAAISLVSAAACKPSGPKEVDAQDNLICREYNLLMSSLQGAYVNFRYEGCTIEITMREDNGWLYLDQFQDEYCLDWDRLTTRYPNDYFVDKNAYLDDMPIHFKDKSEMEWSLLGKYPTEEGETIENYITSIAERDGHITGYAVVYLIADRVFSTPEVIVNKSFPMIRGEYQEIDRAWLDERIETIISEHENKN